VVLRPGATGLLHPLAAFHLCHELYHHLHRDNEGRGIIYAYPLWIEDGVEAAANRFAGYLCGDAP
jgi:Zn-dependent peptidase ImmA (M78 family)